MTTRGKRLRPLFRAQRRRSVLPWYFDLSGKGLFLLVVLGACLLALMALAQTGRVVSVGYHLNALEEEREELLWEREDLWAQIGAASDPALLEQWAIQNGMELLTADDLVFIPAPEEWLPEGGSSSSVADGR